MKKPFSIVKNAYLWLILWVAGMVISWIVFILNAQFSEEFTGGVSITFEGKVSDDLQFQEDLSNYLVDKGFPKMKIWLEKSNTQVSVKLNQRFENDEQVNQISQLIPLFLQESKYIDSTEEIIDQAIIGPSVGDYMQETASQALGFGIIAMVIYMIFSFGTIRKQISPAILAVVVVLTTLISVSFPAGAYGIWMMIDARIQIDTVFIIAILTIIGYGINDAIIIFDRVRENMLVHKDIKGNQLLSVFDDSIWQTMKRSMGTSLSTLLVLIAMMVFWSGVLATFAFTVGTGVIASTLSSIFVAVPTAYLMLTLTKKGK